MSERTALILAFVVILSLVVVAWVGLALVGAKDEVFVPVIMLIGCVGALTVSEIVAHYAPPDERRR